MPRSREPTAPRQLTSAMRKLERALKRIPAEFEYVIHPSKHLWLTYFRGIIYGLGAITAVAIVIPLIVSILQSVEWVPVLGDFIERVVERVEQR